jgi:phenylacetic acid degradation operon negative regulatory protein
VSVAAEPLRPQDLVITLLGTYVRPHGDTVWSGGLVTLLEELGFSHGAARAALTRLVRRGLLARSRSGRLVFYVLTPRCERLLTEGDGRIFALGRAVGEDNDWTLLWHQIPEDRRLERSRLARRLRFLGFGSVQDSVWISPHDHCAEVERLLDELEVAPYATLLKSTVQRGIHPLVSRAWDLEGLADRYEAFCSEFGPYANHTAATGTVLSGATGATGTVVSPELTGTGTGAPPEPTDADAFAVRTRLIHTFRGFAVLDPELPDDLAPLAAAREHAVSTFRQLFDELEPASQRHFDAAVTATG